MKRILFCNVAYMKYYDFELVNDEKPKHGGSYVEKMHDALEKYNFHVCDDGKIRGFVETKYRDGYESAKLPNQIRIERIDPLCKKAEKVDGVTVVFCAISDATKKPAIIGWYKNATVYRRRAVYNGRQYNIECSAKNAYLLDENDRTFRVHRSTESGFGFGSSNLWYAEGEKAAGYVDSVLDYIKSYDDVSLEEEVIPQVVPDKYMESGIGKKVLVNVYERNPLARLRCLELKGTNCAVCGFNAAEVYGDEFKDKIEVHHIIPINEIQKNYEVDPINDLVPVCPNCHMMLHTKMSSGEFPTIELLKSYVCDMKLHQK